MSEIRLDPTPVAGGQGGRRALIVLAVAVALVGLAVLKPWDDRSASGPVPSPTTALSSEVAPDASDVARTAATPDPRTAATADPLPTATADPRSGAPFITPPAPRSAVAWSGIRWRRLAADDPAALVREVVRFDGGFLALGPVLDADGSAGPAWASRDGSAWTPVPRGTWASLWPDQVILAATPVPGGIVALTSSAGAAACAAAATCEPGTSSVVAWISIDGLSWAPQAGTGLRLTDGAPPPLLAGGPAGLLAMDAGAPRSVALSANGGTWRSVPGALPSGFVATGVTAAAGGWLAAGELWSGGRRIAATAWSADGERWDAPVPLPVPTAGAAASGTSGVARILAAGRGLILVGRVDATGAGWDGQQAWWATADDRAWTLRPHVGTPGDGSPPAGRDGTVAADGRRIVALRPDPAGDAWSTDDGVSWRALTASGERPAVAASSAAVLLPGAIVVRSADGAWLGEALVPWPSR
jgi:hypothetical protein